VVNVPQLMGHDEGDPRGALPGVHHHDHWAFPRHCCQCVRFRGTLRQVLALCREVCLIAALSSRRPPPTAFPRRCLSIYHLDIAVIPLPPIPLPIPAPKRSVQLPPHSSHPCLHPCHIPNPTGIAPPQQRQLALASTRSSDIAHLSGQQTRQTRPAAIAIHHTTSSQLNGRPLSPVRRMPV
jgi:hypothetical protein